MVESVTVIVDANVAVAALPVHEPEDPEVLPVTFPVRLPVTEVVKYSS